MSYPKTPTAHYDNLGGINEKASKYQTGLMEFLDLVNFDLNVPGALSKRPGSTQFLFAGTTGQITNIHEFKRLSGFSQIVLSANTGLYAVTAGRTLSAIKTGLTNNVPCDMKTFVDWLWIANGQTYLKYNGATALAVGLEAGGRFGGFSTIGTSSGFFITTRYVWGYVNSRGFYGPANFASMIAFAWPAGFSQILLGGFTLTSSAAAAGASYIALYRNDDPFSFFMDGVGNLIASKAGRFYLLDLLPVTTQTYLDTHGNTSLVNAAVTAKSNFDFFRGFGASASPMFPQFLEIHQNSMFMAGFSNFPSTLGFSDLADPESVKEDYTFEARTDDGDIIRGIKKCGQQMLVFKENSLHKVIGDNSDNYELDEISTEVGALSHWAIVTIDDICFFLDVKGVVAYNGVNWDVISHRMERTFRRMNLANARGKARAVHYDFRHQIWFSFPVDNSTVNNMTVVYDYLAKAWFKFSGPNHASLLRAEGGLGTKTVFFGDYSGMLHHYSPSFLADNGSAFTCIAQPRFDQPQGKNVEALFRRLWLDSEPVSGPTGMINVTLLRNMSSTGLTTMTVYQSQFQSRLEIGVQAKAIGFIFSHAHASLPCQINGWVVAHRWLRDL
jgi:hypothetical protein